jgi:hypothetical protein
MFSQCLRDEFVKRLPWIYAPSWTALAPCAHNVYQPHCATFYSHESEILWLKWVYVHARHSLST